MTSTFRLDLDRVNVTRVPNIYVKGHFVLKLLSRHTDTLMQTHNNRLLYVHHQNGRRLLAAI